MARPRSVVSVHVGQAGVQFGDAQWALLCAEHGIGADGYVLDDTAELASNIHSMFVETRRGRFVPRALLLDLEADAMDKLRTGERRQLWHPDALCNRYEGAANNFARGHWTVGREVDVPERLRVAFERADSGADVLCTHSVCGGTGSGLGARVLEETKRMSRATTTATLTLFPSRRMSTAVVEDYNAVLALLSLMDYVDVCVMLDNEALYRACERELGVDAVSYANTNRLVAQVASSMTSGMRWGDSPSLAALATRLVPYRNLHFCTAGLAPLMGVERAHEAAPSASALAVAAFSPHCTLADVDTRCGAFFAASLRFHGDVSPADVNTAVRHVRSVRELRWFDWMPTGFSTALTRHPLGRVYDSDQCATARAACLLSNSSAMGCRLRALRKRFRKLYSKRAFVYWVVGEGANEFDWAWHELGLLLSDYEDLAREGPQLWGEEREAAVAAHAAAAEAEEAEAWAHADEEEAALWGEDDEL